MSRRPVLRTGISLLMSMVLLLFCAAAGERTRIDLSQVLKASQPSVVIYAVSPQVTFSAGLTPLEFDRYIQRPGVDYTFRISRDGLAQKIAAIIASVDYEPEAGRPSIDLRYRLDFVADDKILESVYADPVGRVFRAGRVLRPLNGPAWLRNVVHVIEEDALLR